MEIRTGALKFCATVLLKLRSYLQLYIKPDSFVNFNRKTKC